MSNYWRYINTGFGLWLSVEHSHNALHKYKSPGPIELPSVTPRLRLKCNPTSLQTVSKTIWYIIVLLHEAMASQDGRCHSDFHVWSRAIRREIFREIPFLIIDPSVWRIHRLGGLFQCRIGACQFSKRYEHLFSYPIRLQDFAKSYNKTFSRIVKRGRGRKWQ